ncbi:unnamed protein product [Arctogadus glacialis]
MQDQYPKEAAEDFPHDAMAITKSQLTSKLKNIRSKYRGAVDTGRRSGQGRVVMLFYELCQEIWGGSPATRCIEGAMESDDLLESPGCSTPTMESPSPHSEESSDCLPPAVVKQRRHLLQAKLDSHRKDRLKRKARPDPVAEAEEDRQMKRREHIAIKLQHCQHLQHYPGRLCLDEGNYVPTATDAICTPPQRTIQ